MLLLVPSAVCKSHLPELDYYCKRIENWTPSPWNKTNIIEIIIELGWSKPNTGMYDVTEDQCFWCKYIWFCRLKRALAQRSLYPGLFTNWPRILWMGFVSEISWAEMKSTLTNDNGREKQTTGMLHYSCVSLSLEINIIQIEVSMTLFAFVILILQFLENNMFSIKIDQCM